MRISADPSDPGYANYLKHGKARCYVDGMLKVGAVTADEEAGTAFCRVMEDENRVKVTWSKRDAHGNRYSTVVTELLHGLIRLEFLRAVKQPAAAPHP